LPFEFLRLFFFLFAIVKAITPRCHIDAAIDAISLRLAAITLLSPRRAAETLRCCRHCRCHAERQPFDTPRHASADELRHCFAAPPMLPLPA